MSIQKYWNRSGILYPDPENDSTFMAWSGPVVTYDDHIKEVNRASETYYQQYIDALWEISYLSERLYYLEGEKGE